MRLTPLAKVFVAMVVLATVGIAGWHFYSQQKGQQGGGSDDKPVAKASGGDGGANKVPEKGEAKSEAKGEAKAPAQKRGAKSIVVGVNDFGGAYPGVVAAANKRFAEAGLDVEIKLIRGSKERLAAYDDGEVDVMLLTLDYFANLVPVYHDKGQELRAFLMADWSRGNLGVVAVPKIKSIEGLRDAKIATTRNTPTHYLLISLLRDSNLSPVEVEKVKSNFVFATKTPLAGEMFQRGEVDAVAIWEPHLSQAMKGGKGHLLVSTATATNLVPDVLFARADWLKAHEAEMTAFARAWFQGVADLEKDPEGAVRAVAAAFKQTPEETRGVLAKIKPATFADNREFFGLEKERGPYLSLFDDASRVWLREGVIKQAAPAGETRWLKALESIAHDHSSEKVIEKFKFSAPKQGATPLLTKSVSIYFASGSDKLDPNARRLLDGFADLLAQFGNAYVRVEGNTDSVGNRGKNVELSKRRARALVDYLSAQFGFDRGRFEAVGNGPDKPVGDNATEAGRDMNRRTDFQIIPND
jgi:NitT/TauT family transport system substrate-binding protein